MTESTAQPQEATQPEAQPLPGGLVTQAGMDSIAAFFAVRDRVQAELEAEQARLGALPEYQVSVYDMDRYSSPDRRQKEANYYRAIEPFQRRFNDWSQDAWRDHIQTSTDPLIHFMGRKCRGHRSFAIEVFQALPCDMFQLELLSQRSDWCTEWDGFVKAAIEEGVITLDNKAQHAKTRELLQFIRRTVANNLYDRDYRTLNTLLQESVQEWREEFGGSARAQKAVAAETAALHVAS